MSDAASFYDIPINDLHGAPIDLHQFEGKKIMIVNVASKCGYTPQYEQLQELHTQKSDKIVVIGVPCNDFGFQEPGNAAEIESFCKMNYGVDFLITEKVRILIMAHPLYKWLTKKSKNRLDNFMVKWNFNKFLIDESGRLVKYYPSATSPIDEEILNWIES